MTNPKDCQLTVGDHFRIGQELLRVTELPVTHVTSSFLGDVGNFSVHDASAAGIIAGTMLLVDDELMAVTAVVGDLLIVTRAQRSAPFRYRICGNHVTNAIVYSGVLYDTELTGIRTGKRVFSPN